MSQNTGLEPDAEQIVKSSGRTPTGETFKFREFSTRRRMRRDRAVTLLNPPGKLIRFDDGSRGVVVKSSVDFYDDEEATSFCWHPEMVDQAHWCYSYTVAIVHPTEEEAAADAAEAAELAAAQQVHDLMTSATTLTGATAGGTWTPIPDEEIAGKIESEAGTGERFASGRLILTRDDRVVYQHPGFYSDYVRMEGISTDPDLVARVRSVLAGGTRRASGLTGGQLPTYYAVTVSDA